MQTREYNFDGLIGPTHNFSGLASGNIASAKNRFSISHPKKAALQGLAKIKLLMELGLSQGIIPPQERPNLTALQQDLKLKGSDRQILEKISQQDFDTFLKYCSASSMWVANAATVSPSNDTADQRIHITPANLVSQKHRAIEGRESPVLLKHIFKDEEIFVHHPPLKNSYLDEGAANHMRLSREHNEPGMEVFVYGKKVGGTLKPRKYTARQSLEASAAIAKVHKLKPEQTLFLQQNPFAIDSGVFHNDVIAVSNEEVVLYHEKAFVDSDELVRNLSERGFCGIKIPASKLTVSEAVRAYFFNSQIVTLPSDEMALILPKECQDGGKIEALVREIVSQNNPLKQFHFVDLKESMRNGGGPACLRLRVVLNDQEAQGVAPGFILNDSSFAILEKWVKKHYRDRLDIRDLADYALLKESRAALDELTQLLKLGPIYPFQK